jgi:shikimate kinase/3-dehydroquinate synthase
MTSPNLILTGFMGTGKTVVGQAVAERLGRWFVDMDAVIERQAGKPVSAIFRDEGEPAFRRLEAALCGELSSERNLVIATGGGALVAEANRAALGETGLLICLDAPVDVILQRLERADDRPLLAGPDRRARVEALLAQRAVAYATIPHHIDTAGLAVEQVVERVIRLARQMGSGPVRIPVAYPGGSYELLIGDGALGGLGQAMVDAGLQPGRCAVVSQPAIAAAHAGRLGEGLAEAGFDPVLVKMPDGEAHKTLAAVAALYEAFVAAGLDRRSPVIALGGGVVGGRGWLRRGHLPARLAFRAGAHQPAGHGRCQRWGQDRRRSAAGQESGGCVQTAGAGGHRPGNPGDPAFPTSSAAAWPRWSRRG